MTRGLAPLLILAILGTLALAMYQGVWWMTAPVSSPSIQPPPRIVFIPEGSTLRQVAVLLEQAGLIRNRGSFLILGKMAAADRRILAGEYELHAGMRPAEILSRILNGQVVLHAVTIPEGYTFIQIADLLSQKGLSDPDEFLRLTRDKQYIRTLNLDVATLEGYLFPDTYRFARNAKAKDVITTMVTGLWEVFTPELRQRAKEVNMTVHDVLTLASVIEKETSVDLERELISAVFHNRLRRRI
ncbi:MAG TPA: endolytic transglycosylase MltG, partial [Nitrospiraceae bacterium]|nr:endolytic transglycosylase MltG [Nitrospiraceae bacterium]